MVGAEVEVAGWRARVGEDEEAGSPGALRVRVDAEGGRCAVGEKTRPGVVESAICMASDCSSSGTAVDD